MVRDATEAMPDRNLKDQMRRAAASVMANIAEGSERGTNADFRRFLAMAHGSVGELRNHLVVASDDRLVDEAPYLTMHDCAVQLSKMIAGFMKSLARGGG